MTLDESDIESVLFKTIQLNALAKLVKQGKSAFTLDDYQDV